jgi:hypothetical protein
VFRDSTKEGLSIDDVLQLVLDPFGCKLDEFNAEDKTLSQQTMFKVLSWLTMIFKALDRTVDGKF